AAMTAVEDYKGFTLSDATAEEKSAYVAEVMATFADKKPTLADIADTDAGIPFYIFLMTDSDGPYYYAETIVGGTSLDFCCYYYDVTLLPDNALLADLETVLRTLRLTGGSDSDQI
ncbi:MAG: hypothetical protein PHY64_09470, partial [Eubacteriales bacterium]|nr:hypothetical protein [Eubacteriales bacterium]